MRGSCVSGTRGILRQSGGKELRIDGGASHVGQASIALRATRDWNVEFPFAEVSGTGCSTSQRLTTLHRLRTNSGVDDVRGARHWENYQHAEAGRRVAAGICCRRTPEDLMKKMTIVLTLTCLAIGSV